MAANSLFKKSWNDICDEFINLSSDGEALLGGELARVDAILGGELPLVGAGLGGELPLVDNDKPVLVSTIEFGVTTGTLFRSNTSSGFGFDFG